MRLTLLALLAGIALPAAAQEASPTLFQQFFAAREVFLGGTDETSEYLGEFRLKLLDALGGDWFPIGALDIEDDDPAAFAKPCDRRPILIEVPDPYSFSLSFGAPEQRVTTLYTNRGGNLFGAYTPIPDYLDMIGMGGEDVDPERLAMPIAGAPNGLATIHRPFPDILVIQLNYLAPQILARCPG